MKQGKKSISPGAWFSVAYPTDWNELEDGEGSFLFYNPNEWIGNLRILAHKGGATYGEEAIEQELKENILAASIKVRPMSCVYGKEMFGEGGVYYASHLWVVGMGNVAFGCSFMVREGELATKAENITVSLEVHRVNQKYSAEITPVRLSEIYQADEACGRVGNAVKEYLKKDFQGQEEDIASVQQVMDSDSIGAKKKKAWLALGITLCTILVSEAEGFKWRMLTGGSRETPVPMNVADDAMIDSMKLT